MCAASVAGCGPFCPACAARDVSVFAASGKGRLYSYVIHHRPVPGFTPPYAIAVVELVTMLSVVLRVPKLFNLRMDPFERADATSNTYYDWMLDNVYLILAATFVTTQFLETFKEFPPAQAAASFTIDQAVEKLQTALAEGQ